MDSGNQDGWKRNPIGLWIMIGAGIGRILWSGAALVMGRLIRRGGSR